eukprot:gb/GFBE01082949.1/.p1 GENE.gb/GFBE01082949.1/~~gb/GFBE01082949.1/.p1  ORF type:complete len:308 (+),score=59.23 gb/GFBE01082949.1/:1-924(+)
MALQLEYRSTFIDIKEEATVLQPRSFSLPAVKVCVHVTEASEEEGRLKDYVTTLAQRAEQLRIMMTHRGSEGSKHPAGFGKDRGTESELELATCLTEAPSSTHYRRHGGGLGSANTTSTLPTVDYSLTLGSLPALESEEFVLSSGSMGHPEICRRPCLFFARGECAGGSSCDYCHLPHEEKSIHLDKRQRETVLQLAPPEFLALVSQCMTSRAKATGILEAASEVLSIMETLRLAAAVKEKQEATTLPKIEPCAKSVAKLGYFLSKMSFHALLSVVLRHPTTKQANAEQLTVALSRMRLQLADCSGM